MGRDKNFFSFFRNFFAFTKDTIYIEAQMRVIEGKTPIEEAHGLLLRSMQEKALSSNDTEILSLLKSLAGGIK